MIFVAILSVLGQVPAVDHEIINILLSGNPQDIYNLPDPHQAVLKSVGLLHKLQLSNYQKSVLWDVYKSGRSPEELTAEELGNITELLPAVPEHDLSRLNVSDWNIVKILSQVRYFTRPQATVIINSLNLDVLKAEHINLLSGLVCGIPESTLSQIPKTEFEKIGSSVFSHLYSCSDTQLKVLLDQVLRIYGGAPTWSPELLQHIGMIILALDKAGIRTLRPITISGLNIQIITQFKPELLDAFTGEQLRYLNASSKMQISRELFKSGTSQMPVPMGLLLTYLLLIF